MAPPPSEQRPTSLSGGYGSFPDAESSFSPQKGICNDHGHGRDPQNDATTRSTASSSFNGKRRLARRIGTDNGPPDISTTTINTNTRVLATVFLAALTTGAPTYAFGVYGATLKRDFHLTQSQLATIAASSFAAGLVSWVPGLMVDHCGPRQALQFGGSALGILLGCNWLVAKRFVELPQSWIVPVLASLAFLTFAANSLVIGSVFKSLVVTCRHGKGAAVGAAKAYVGLGAGVYVSLFDAIFNPSTASTSSSSDLDFLLLASVASFVCIALPGCIPGLLPGRNELKRLVDATTSRHFQVVYLGLAGMACAVLGSSVRIMFRPHPSTSSTAPSSSSTSGDSPSSSFGGVHGAPCDSGEPGGGWWHVLLLLGCCFVPLLALPALDNVPTTLSQHSYAAAEPSDGVAHGGDAFEDTSDDDHKVDDFDDDNNYYDRSNDERMPLQVYDPPRISERPRSYSVVVDDLSLTQMLARPSAWLFLATCTVVVGSGTLVTTHAGQMVESLQFPPKAAVASLSLFSVSQAASRALTGYLSEHLWRRCHTPRTAFAVLSVALGAAGHTVLALASDRPTFATGVILVGLSFGMIWPLMVLIVGDLYGKLYHGANYMLYDGFTSAVGTLLLARWLAPTLYEREIRTEKELTCYGPSCFAATHSAVALLCGLACALAGALLILTRQSYRPTPILV